MHNIDTHGMHMYTYIQVYLLVIYQYAYKFMFKYLQTINIFFRLIFYIAYS